MSQDEHPLHTRRIAMPSMAFKRSNCVFFVVIFVTLTYLSVLNVIGAVVKSGSCDPAILANQPAEFVMLGYPRLSEEANSSTSTLPVAVSETSRAYHKRSSSQQQQDHKRVRPLPLDELTAENGTQPCDDTQHILMQSQHIAYDELFNGNRRIPRIIHQTSRSRCMTKTMASIAHHWASIGTDWAYYFHSDTAVDRLLAQDWPEFPHLSIVVACLEGRGTLKADLWRYLVLWEYGGVYADLDTKPNLFNATTIRDEDDGFFVVEQYHLLSQYFMVMSPRHPIMFYAIQDVLSSLLQVTDTGQIRAPHVTGPHALHRGFQAFRRDVGVKVPEPEQKPVQAGVWNGTDQRKITVVGVAANENEYVEREYIRRPAKLMEYKEMGMKHFTKDRVTSRITCMQRLWQEQQVHEKVQTPTQSNG